MDDDEGLERLLDYHGRLYTLANRWVIRLRVFRVEASAGRPQGIKYSFMLHDDSGKRLLGFDNAHSVKKGAAYDHQHRFRNTIETTPYAFRNADLLLSDFFTAVRKACLTEGVAFEVTDETVETLVKEVEDDEDSDT